MKFPEISRNKILKILRAIFNDFKNRLFCIIYVLFHGFTEICPLLLTAARDVSDFVIFSVFTRIALATSHLAHEAPIFETLVRLPRLVKRGKCSSWSQKTNGAVKFSDFTSCT